MLILFFGKSRTTDPGNESAGQLTIFYCGKVNVYDDVPAEKVP